MIGDLKPYPAYEDSGLDWMDSIPAHWVLVRAKRLFREVDERSKTGKEELLSVSHLTVARALHFGCPSMDISAQPRPRRKAKYLRIDSHVHGSPLVLSFLWPEGRLGVRIADERWNRVMRAKAVELAAGRGVMGGGRGPTELATRRRPREC